jgi:hypothetical protein
MIFCFQCETLGFEGWGFRRGGYQCACQPGYYYPWWHDGPFLGEEIEQATREEYEAGFDCLPIYGKWIKLVTYQGQVLALNCFVLRWNLSLKQVRIPINRLTQTNVCAFQKPGPGILVWYVMIFRCKWIVCFVDIGGIVDHYCFKLSFS